MGGYNNICIMFDDPPFSYMGSTLWFPETMLLLSFEVFDYIRVHDHYIDGDDRYDISRCFITYYTLSTILESISIVIFAQVFATSPREHLHIHTWPYLGLLYSLWLIVLKRFLYRYRVSATPCYSVLFVILLGISTVIKCVLDSANLYGARLWETYDWTMKLEQ